MQEEINSPNQYTALTPVETWIKALTQPNKDTYEKIVNDPGGTVGKAILWLVLGGFIGGLLAGSIQAITGASFFQQVSQFAGGYSDIPFQMPGRATFGFWGIVRSAFGGLIGTVIGAVIYTALVQLVARMLGGTGSFDKLFYGFAAYSAPLGMVTTVIAAIPFLGCLGIPLAIYGLVLNVIANQATNEYDTGKAVLSSLAPALLIFLFCCCVIAVITIAGGAILGPAVDNVFNSITNY